MIGNVTFNKMSVPVPMSIPVQVISPFVQIMYPFDMCFLISFHLNFPLGYIS